ncbi:MAG: peptidyl-prolyl cis-trans isomerase [Candidatus Brocadia fulgida]|uniref:Peptidyl-prolyl cis-trans isomerase n=1 Tax=Candidatus Brocadia fulgida TaxID=380242 RepID=A0A0M2UYF2_9BACT|nr:MAG: peptidyl-prolyl cis-trans isomerase [Candidatus Brocadia fulgida]
MKKFIVILVITFFCFAQPVMATSPNPRVRLETNKGTIILELNQKAAPKTVENFLGYVSNGFYNGTIFHRVIKDFMIQGAVLPPICNKNPHKLPLQTKPTTGSKIFVAPWRWHVPWILILPQRNSLLTPLTTPSLTTKGRIPTTGVIVYLEKLWRV